MASGECTIDGCSKPVKCKGLCNAHYIAHIRKYGSPGAGECKKEGCTRPAYCKGYCAICRREQYSNLNSHLVQRDLALDELAIELIEVFRYIRKSVGIGYKGDIESRICRRLAFGCIKHLHIEIHKQGNPNRVITRDVDGCHKELARRCQELRYTEAKELLHKSKGINTEAIDPYEQHIRLDR